MKKADLTDNPRWLTWAREIFSIAQAGLTYNTNDFDRQGYRRLQEISAQMLADRTGSASGPIVEDFSVQAGYATPKVDVRGAVIRDGRILLVREAVDGRWAMPGGWGDIGDFPAAMVAREVREESGFKVSVDKLVGVFDLNREHPHEFFHVYKLVFLCTILEGRPAPSLETLEVDFFGMDSLPPLSERRTNRRILEEVFAHHAQPGRPAFFD